MKNICNVIVVVFATTTINLFSMWGGARQERSLNEGVLSAEHQEEIERKKIKREEEEQRLREDRMRARQRALVNPQTEADQEQRRIRIERIRQGLSGL